MSQLTNVTQSMTVTRAKNIASTSEYLGMNLFFHAEMINFNGKCNIKNRATLIGVYSGVPQTTLIARKVEFFSSIDDLFTKVASYASASVQGKNIIDAVEILLQVISIMDKDSLRAGILLANIFLENTATQFSDEDKAKIINSVERLLDPFPEDEELQAKIVQLMIKEPITDHSREYNKDLLHKIQFLEKAYRPEEDQKNLTHNLSINLNLYGVLCNEGEIDGKNINDAVDYLRKAVGYNPNNEIAKQNLASLLYRRDIPSLRDSEGYIEKSKISKAIEVLLEIVKLAPENQKRKSELSDLYHIQAELLMLQKKSPAEIIPMFDLSCEYETNVESKPKNAYLYVANVYDVTQNLSPEARMRIQIECLEKFLKVDPGDKIEKNNLGILYSNLATYLLENATDDSMLEKAEELYEKSLQIDPNSLARKVNFSHLCSTRAINLFKKTSKNEDDYFKTLSYFKKALELNPEDSYTKRQCGNSCFNLACFYLNGKADGKGKKEAMILLEEGVKFNSKDEEMSNLLENLKSQQ